MPAAAKPHSEAERLRALRSYDVLDTACETAFDELTQLAARITGSPMAVVSLIDEERQWFKAKVGIGDDETSRDISFCAHAILNPEEMLVVPDARRDPRFSDNPVVTGEMQVRFYAGTPLVNPEGHALGTLCVIDRAPREISTEQKETLRALARAVMTTLELRRSMLSIRSLALTDALTGLPNRAAFLDALDKAFARLRRDQQPVTMLYLDLDGFKAVNDAKGHDAGDEVLREVASVLSQTVRREDIAARLGGDEFAVLLAGSDSGETQRIGDRLREEIGDSMLRHGWAVTASVGGVTFLAPPDSVSAALRAVDERMYQAKRAGRNRLAWGNWP